MNFNITFAIMTCFVIYCLQITTDCTENSENQLNPIIIRIRKPYKNENAPYLSFPCKRESRKIITKKWIPDAVYPLRSLSLRSLSMRKQGAGSRGRSDVLLYPMSIYWFHIALGFVGCIFTMCKKTEGESVVCSSIDILH